jgi:hypothetical protein
MSPHCEIASVGPPWRDRLTPEEDDDARGPLCATQAAGEEAA